MNDDHRPASPLSDFERQLSSLQPRKPRIDLATLTNETLAFDQSRTLHPAFSAPRFWTSVAASWICGAMMGAAVLWTFIPQVKESNKDISVVTGEMSANEFPIDQLEPDERSVAESIGPLQIDSAAAEKTVVSPVYTRQFSQQPENLERWAFQWMDSGVLRPSSYRLSDIVLTQQELHSTSVNQTSFTTSMVDIDLDPARIRPVTTRHDLMRDLQMFAMPGGNGS